MKIYVEDMTCNHCVATITKIIGKLSPDAKVDVNLAKKEVQIEGNFDPKAIVTAIADAGYSPQEIA